MNEPLDRTVMSFWFAEFSLYTLKPVIWGKGLGSAEVTEKQ